MLYLRKSPIDSNSLSLLLQLPRKRRTFLRCLRISLSILVPIGLLVSLITFVSIVVAISSLLKGESIPPRALWGSLAMVGVLSVVFYSIVAESAIRKMPLGDLFDEMMKKSKYGGNWELANVIVKAKDQPGEESLSRIMARLVALAVLRDYESGSAESQGLSAKILTTIDKLRSHGVNTPLLALVSAHEFEFTKRVKEAIESYRAYLAEIPVDSEAKAALEKLVAQEREIEVKKQRSCTRCLVTVLEDLTFYNKCEQAGMRVNRQTGDVGMEGGLYSYTCSIQDAFDRHGSLKEKIEKEHQILSLKRGMRCKSCGSIYCVGCLLHYPPERLGGGKVCPSCSRGEFENIRSFD